MLKFLGRGSAFNIAEGNTAAFLKENNKLLLFDCGHSVFDAIIKNNLLNNISKIIIFITHMHADHIGSLSTLLYYCKNIIRIPVNIYFDDKESLSEYLTLQGNDIDNVFSLPYVSENYKMDSIITNHVSDLKCYGYKILDLNKNKYYYYSGDSNDTSKTLEFLRDDNCEIMYLDCSASYNSSHVDMDRLEELIKNEQNKTKINLMHIDDIKKIKAKAKALGLNIVKII